MGLGKKLCGEIRDDVLICIHVRTMNEKILLNPIFRFEGLDSTQNSIYRTIVGIGYREQNKVRI